MRAILAAALRYAALSALDLAGRLDPGPLRGYGSFRTTSAPRTPWRAEVN